MKTLLYYIDCLLLVLFSITLSEIHLIFSIFGLAIAIPFSILKFYDYIKTRNQLKTKNKQDEKH